MEFKRISADKLQIILTNADMQALNIRYEHLSYSDDGTKSALLSLLEFAKRDAGFAPRGSKLFIEVYPKDDGCALYITAMQPEHTRQRGVYKPGPPPAVFEFADEEPLIRCAVHTAALYTRQTHRSALYRFKGKYRIVVQPLDFGEKLGVYALGEFGRAVGEGDILAAFTAEHGEEILAEGALETLAEYFSQDA